MPEYIRINIFNTYHILKLLRYWYGIVVMSKYGKVTLTPRFPMHSLYSLAVTVRPASRGCAGLRPPGSRVPRGTFSVPYK